MPAVLDIGDQVVQWLGADADDKAGDQHAGPQRRPPGAVGADGLQERDLELSAQKTSCHLRDSRG
jgi:hypothetical protein